jgi:hypothetical protein
MSDSFSAATIVDGTVAASNTFTSTLSIADTDFIFAVSGTFVGTVTLQMRPKPRDITHNWIDEQSWTTPTVAAGRVLKGPWEIQAGFKAGDYTSGSAHITLAG